MKINHRELDECAIILPNRVSPLLPVPFSALCLKDLSIFVPDPILVGDIATLTCNFDLETVSHFETLNCGFSLALGDSKTTAVAKRGGSCSKAEFLMKHK